MLTGLHAALDSILKTTGIALALSNRCGSRVGLISLDVLSPGSSDAQPYRSPAPTIDPAGIHGDQDVRVLSPKITR